MKYGSSDVILDANIHDDESMGGVIQRHNSHIIKLTNSDFEVVIIAFAK